MTPLGPRDWLECVDDRPHDGRPVPLVIGAKYQVEAVWVDLPHRGDPNSEWVDCAVDLVGVPGPAEHLAWGLYRFRPLGGEIFTSARSRTLEDA